MTPKNNLYSGLSEIAGIYDHLNGNLLDSFNKTELDTVGFKIPDKIIKEFKIKMKKFNIRSKSFDSPFLLNYKEMVAKYKDEHRKLDKSDPNSKLKIAEDNAHLKFLKLKDEYMRYREGIRKKEEELWDIIDSRNNEIKKCKDRLSKAEEDYRNFKRDDDKKSSEYAKILEKYRNEYLELKEKNEKLNIKSKSFSNLSNSGYIVVIDCNKTRAKHGGYIGGIHNFYIPENLVKSKKFIELFDGGKFKIKNNFLDIFEHLGYDPVSVNDMTPITYINLSNISEGLLDIRDTKINYSKDFSENKESYVTCNTTNPNQLMKILNAIKEHGNTGHSFEIIIDAGNENEEKFSWDGDGADRIETIETDGAKLYSVNNSDNYYVVTHQNGVVDSWFGPYFHNEAEKVEDKIADELESGFTVGIWSLDTLLNKLNKQRKGNYTADLVNSHAEKITFSDKMYSEMTVGNDPSIMNQENPNLDSKSLATKREGMNMNWSVQNPFNLSIEPWLVANVINGKPDGLYVGSLLGDSIDLGSEHISLDIKLGNSQPTDVFVIVREGKAIIFKVSQLTKKDKVFSVGDYDYRFSIVPTEVSYEMQYLIGSWMMASSICHLYHICDNKYAGHVALDEFYTEFPEKIDALAEHFLADNDKAEFRVCVIPGQCPIDYLTRLLQFTLKYVELNEGKIPSSYQSQLDEIVCFTQSILYKLKRLDSGRRIFSIKK